MLVSEILANKGSDVVTASASDTAADLAKLFRSKRIGAAVVVDAGGAVLGIVAERSIVHGMADHGRKVLRMRASALMSAPAVTCRPDHDVKHVMAVMTHRRIRHLAVVDDGRLCGIVSIGDVVKPHLDETALEINVLRDYARLRAV